MKRRSTYSEKNALKFKPTFDKAILKNESFKIPIKNCSPITYQVKLCDALRFLIENFDKEHEIAPGQIHKEGDYARFRGNGRFRQVENGFVHWIFFKDEDLVTSVTFFDDKLTKEKTWKDEIMAYVEDPTRWGQKIILNNLLLSQEDVEWAENVLSSVIKDAADGIYIVQSDLIVVSISSAKKTEVIAEAISQ